jgi:hypothetical protein
VANTPNNNVSVQVNKTTLGKLNTDTVYEDLSGGDYPNRVNVEFNNDADFADDTPTWGHKNVVNIPDVEIRNQRLRIYVNSSARSIELKFYNQNNVLINTGPIENTIGGLANNKQAIINILNNFSYPFSFNLYDDSINYLDVSVSFFYCDYSFSILDDLGTIWDTDILFEAIDLTCAGTLICHGKRDYNGNTFQTHTTQDKLPLSLDIVTLESSNQGIILQVLNHGLTTNEVITVTNVTTVSNLNGNWTVTVINSNEFLLNGTPTPPPSPPFPLVGKIITNPYGYGQVGVLRYLPDSDSYQYVRLIGSKQFNFNTQKQTEFPVSFANGRISINITDNYNRPYTIYNKGAFFNDSAVKVFNPTNGIYSYANLKEQISTQVNFNNYTVSFTRQLGAGGSLLSGNKRYAINFITEGGTTSELSQLTNMVSVYLSSYANSSTVQISGTLVQTGKINVINVTGIRPSVFKYIQLICFEYLSDSNTQSAVNSYIVRKELLLPDQTSIELQHTGNELTRFFDSELANQVQPDFLRVGTVDLIANRLVYGNITNSEAIDFSEWAKTFNYSIIQKPIYGSFGAQTYYEFYDVNNINTATSFCPFEWERFYVVFELLNGKLTQAFFTADVRFVTQDDYTANTEYQFLDTNGSAARRDFSLDDFTDYSLMNADNFYLQLGIRFSNINWDYLIDGIAVRNLVKRIRIHKCQTVKEVLANGSVHLSEASRKKPTFVVFPNPNYYSGALVPNTFTDRHYDNGVELVNYNGTDVERQRGSFYSTDIWLGETDYEFIQGDKVINYGQQRFVSINQGTEVGAESVNIWTLTYSVFMPKTGVFLDIISAKFLGEGEGATLAPNSSYVKRTFTDENDRGLKAASFVIQTTQSFFPRTINEDIGFAYQAAIFRQRNNKYGNINQQNILEDLNGVISVNETKGDAFGGSCFIQQMQFKQTAGNPAAPFGGKGYNIVSCNYANSNLRLAESSTTNQVFPVTVIDWLTWLKNQYFDQQGYSSQYNIQNNVQSRAVFDVNLEFNSELITRKYYSQINLINSISDQNRVFLPFDFADNMNTYGEISLIANINDELFTFQQNSTTREFFNSEGRLTTIEDGTVAIGDGTVLSRRGLRLSAFGTNHRWTFVKGLSDSGKEVAYWFNIDFHAIMRFGQDGTVNLSERGMMKTFLRQNTRFVRNKFTPAHDQGAHAVWDDRGKNYILTVRAWKDSLDWSSDSVAYRLGQTVLLGQLWGVPIMYQCLIAHVSSNDNSPTSVNGSTYWIKREFTDNNYYNLFTLVYNEKKNAFSHYYTFYPKIYINNLDRYLSYDPITANQNKLYLHREDSENPLVFYDVEHEGVTEYVINIENTLVKKYSAIAYSSLLKPYKTEFETLFISNNGQQFRFSGLVRSDFNMRESNAFSPIKQNSDTAPMVGQWLLIRTFFKAREQQKISDTITSLRFTQRNNKNA